MENILLTNDDGYKSAGFLPLVRKLAEKYLVTAVPPSRERSWVGKSMTAHKEVTLKKKSVEGFEMFIVDGTPADCAQIGLHEVIKNRPKFLVAGINIGENVGYGRILSSGTIGAAMEASLDGIKSVASSLYIPHKVKIKTNFFQKTQQAIFENAANITLKVINILSKINIPEGIDLVSVNIPFEATENSAIVFTHPFRRSYGRLFKKTARGYKHQKPVVDFKHLENGTDLKALSEGKISLTPISLELSTDQSVSVLKRSVSNKW